jgi:hypothetical protein
MDANDTRETPDPQQLLTALSTEHFTLQGARSQTMSESCARGSVYVFSVSSALVALGFIGQLDEVGNVIADQACEDRGALRCRPRLLGLRADRQFRVGKRPVERQVGGTSSSRSCPRTRVGTWMRRSSSGRRSA